MSFQIVDVVGGLVTVKVGGLLTPAEHARAQERLVEFIPKQGKVKALVLAQDFQGWSKGDWSDVSFQARHDRDIEKIAFVGDPKWDDLARSFTGKGFREVRIEFFADADEARAWLAD